MRIRTGTEWYITFQPDKIGTGDLKDCYFSCWQLCDAKWSCSSPLATTFGCSRLKSTPTWRHCLSQVCSWGWESNTETHVNLICVDTYAAHLKKRWRVSQNFERTPGMSHPSWYDILGCPLWSETAVIWFCTGSHVNTQECSIKADGTFLECLLKSEVTMWIFPSKVVITFSMVVRWNYNKNTKRTHSFGRTCSHDCRQPDSNSNKFAVCLAKVFFIRLGSANRNFVCFMLAVCVTLQCATISTLILARNTVAFF